MDIDVQPARFTCEPEFVNEVPIHANRSQNGRCPLDGAAVGEGKFVWCLWLRIGKFAPGVAKVFRSGRRNCDFASFQNCQGSPLGRHKSFGLQVRVTRRFNGDEPLSDLRWVDRSQMHQVAFHFATEGLQCPASRDGQFRRKFVAFNSSRLHLLPSVASLPQKPNFQIFWQLRLRTESENPNSHGSAFQNNTVIIAHNQLQPTAPFKSQNRLSVSVDFCQGWKREIRDAGED